MPDTLITDICKATRNQTFAFFVDLPLEVRRKIWYHAIANNRPRNIYIFLNETICIQPDPKTIITMLSVNQESHREVIHHNPITNIWRTTTEKAYKFNLEHDAFFFLSINGVLEYERNLPICEDFCSLAEELQNVLFRAYQLEAFLDRFENDGEVLGFWSLFKRVRLVQLILNRDPGRPLQDLKLAPVLSAQQFRLRLRLVDAFKAIRRSRLDIQPEIVFVRH